jgi:hypothetical protein
LNLFHSENEEETHIRCPAWAAATALIGHDFRPGFGLSFAAFRAESCRIAA